MLTKSNDFLTKKEGHEPPLFVTIKYSVEHQFHNRVLQVAIEFERM